jgi:hypothetical protein
VFPAGTTNRTGPVPGGEAAYMEAADIDQTRLDAGQGLKGLPGSILQMTGNPLQVINPANLPVDPGTCKPILPNQYIHVNTIFNVASNAGLRTAWSDKHPANQVLPGPSGNGPQDYFTPEINSTAVGYTGGMSKIAEHGGNDPQDRNVPILVVLPGSHNGGTITSAVETTQIAPTILALLGLHPNALQAVQIEHTQVLPGIEG